MKGGWVALIWLASFVSAVSRTDLFICSRRRENVHVSVIIQRQSYYLHFCFEGWKKVGCDGVLRQGVPESDIVIVAGKNADIHIYIVLVWGMCSLRASQTLQQIQHWQHSLTTHNTSVSYAATAYYLT